MAANRIRPGVDKNPATYIAIVKIHVDNHREPRARGPPACVAIHATCTETCMRDAGSMENWYRFEKFWQ